MRQVTRVASVLTLFCLIITLIYLFGPLSHNPREMIHAVTRLSDNSFLSVLIFVVFIVIGSLALIPINILLVAAALIFPGWKGFFCGLCGAILTTLVEYALGRYMVSPEFIEKKCGDRVRFIREKFAANGLLAMTFLSLVPVSPHIVNNLVAGVCRIKIIDLLIGTSIGIIPGLLVINIFGRSLRKFIAEPNFLTAGIVIITLMTMFLLGKFIRKSFFRKNENDLPSVR